MFVLTVNEISNTEVTVATTLEGLSKHAALCGVRVGVPSQIPDTITCSFTLFGRFVKTYTPGTGGHFCVLEIEVFSL